MLKFFKNLFTNKTNIHTSNKNNLKDIHIMNNNNIKINQSKNKNCIKFKIQKYRYIYAYNNKAIDKIFNKVDDDFFIFESFNDADFGKTCRFKPSSTVLRFIDYRIYQGKTFEEAIKESLSITKSIRSYRRVIKKYKSEVNELIKDIKIDANKRKELLWLKNQRGYDQYILGLIKTKLSESNV